MIYFDSTQARASSMAGVLRDLGWHVNVTTTPEGPSRMVATPRTHGGFSMAAGVLPDPGTTGGPCATPCKHKDCAQTRTDALTFCVFCTKTIGYGTGFYRARLSGRLAHADCLEIAVERNDARVGEF